MGAPPEVIEGFRADKERDQRFGVWPQNWNTVQAFHASITQWRVAVGMAGGGRTGFDYAGVRAGLKMAGLALSPDEWADFRHMEIAALNALNEGQE